MDAYSEAAARRNLESALSRLEGAISDFISKPAKYRLPSGQIVTDATDALSALVREPAAKLVKAEAEALTRACGTALSLESLSPKLREQLVGRAQSFLTLVEGLRLDKVGVAENGDLISCPNGFAAESSRHRPESLLRLDLGLVVDRLRELDANGEAEKLEQLQIHLATNHNRVEKCLLRLAGLRRWENRVKGAPLRAAIRSALQAIEASRSWAAQQAVVEREMESARWNSIDLDAKCGVVTEPPAPAAPTNTLSAVGGEAAGPPAKPLVYLTSWAEILNALEKPNEESVRQTIRSLHDEQPSPILFGGKGRQPRVEKSKLLDWWNGLEERWAELAARKRDEAATIEEQHPYGRDGVVIPGIAGSKRRSRRKRPSTS